MKNVRKKKFFTLVELLVSLGVFSILLIVFMQFFSGMRLVWSNAEKNSNTHADVRLAMDMLSTLLSSLYYSTANTESGEVGHFLFNVVSGGTDQPDRIYFASKTRIDLGGSSPIRFIGVLVPNCSNSSDLTSENDLHNKLYLTVLTNKEGPKNANVYRQLFPQFVDSSGDNVVELSTAASTLESNLNGKLEENSTPDTDTDNRIKLLDNVVQFKVRLLKADGTSESGSVITMDTRQIEIEISVLKDEDYRQWLNKRGTGTTEPAAAKEFRALRQSTFTRRIYLSDRSLQEDRYE